MDTSIIRIGEDTSIIRIGEDTSVIRKDTSIVKLGMCMRIKCLAPCADIVVLAEVTMTNDIPKCYSKEIEHG